MTTLPLGLGAYKRTFAQEPEIRLENRLVEANPTNLKEHTALIGRPGTKLLTGFAPDLPSGKLRGFYTKLGLFNDDLFAASGANFYRYDGTTRTHITGVLHGTDSPRVTWSKGIGYEYLFIADGTALYYYDGGSKASGVLSSDGTADHTAKVVIEGVYYTWTGSLTDALSDGTSAHPWVVKPGATVAEDLANLADALNFDGVAGTDFSANLAGPSLVVTAVAAATSVTVKYVDSTAAGNAITTTVSGATHLSWGAGTLTGGAVHVLHQVLVPEAQPISTLTSIASYVLASVADTQKFYFIPPGDTTIDALNFAEKESSPDPIIDMATVGDVAVIAGAGSIEFWMATGEADNPFAPVEGRTMSRGIVAGTLVVVDESTFIMVGNDWRVYSVSSSPQAISDKGIEERIRKQLRREAGLSQ
jgi:hypothetical protein